MSALLSAGLQNNIRFETNYLHHSRTLQIINKARFRALGSEGCRAFVTHAARVGDEYRLSRIGSVAYVIYLMHWLGSYFYADPRYADLHAALQSHETETDRIEAARDRFMAIAARHIGEHGEILMDRLARIEDLDPLIVDGHSEIATLHDRLRDVFGPMDPDTPSARGFIEAQAGVMAQNLGVQTPLGQRTCLMLTFILGIRADLDPLFPWICDTVEAAKKKNAPPDAALFAYGKKRLGAVLRQAGNKKGDPNDV